MAATAPRSHIQTHPLTPIKELLKAGCGWPFFPNHELVLTVSVLGTGFLPPVTIKVFLALIQRCFWIMAGALDSFMLCWGSSSGPGPESIQPDTLWLSTEWDRQICSVSLEITQCRWSPASVPHLTDSLTRHAGLVPPPSFP